MDHETKKILGVDGGGTKTAWVLLEKEGNEMRAVRAGKLPPSNFRLTSTDRLRAILCELPQEADRVGIFLAGCGTAEDNRSLSVLAAEVWPQAKVFTGSDRDSGVAAALQDRDGIAVNAGTGSSITGRCGSQIEKAGGWGHILGDAGGGYYLSLQALRLTLREYDLHRGEEKLAANILRALCLNNFDELVRWAQTADKMEIATLAPVVFAAAEEGDARVREIIEGGARVLAEYTVAVAGRLGLKTPEVKLLGGLFQCCSVYAAAFQRELSQRLPDACVEVCDRPPEWGAAWLASSFSFSSSSSSSRERVDLAAAATEQINLRSSSLDTMTPRELVELFVNEEQFVEDALRGAIPELATAIELITEALRNGGRLFYAGAGTSGRLGVLDASEIPPTFGAAADLVQGIIAGGMTALHRSVEGAEDEAGAGALAMDERGVGLRDIVCGITASGRTPFVLGALTRARSLGAQTLLLTCNPARPQIRSFDLEIDLATGPELLAGSTRLKAASATKVALNILSTGAMVALGKVRGNRMMDLVASNGKLRDRAARLLSELTKCSHDEAMELLAAHGWNLRAAVDFATQGVTLKP